MLYNNVFVSVACWSSHLFQVRKAIQGHVIDGVENPTYVPTNVPRIEVTTEDSDGGSDHNIRK